MTSSVTYLRTGAGPTPRGGLEVHASLMHACTRRIKKSLIHIAGFDLTTLDVEGSDCRGCRFGKTVKYGRKRATAPPTRRTWRK